LLWHYVPEQQHADQLTHPPTDSALSPPDILPYFVAAPSETAKMRSLWGVSAAYSCLVGCAALIAAKVQTAWNSPGLTYYALSPAFAPPIAAIVLALTWRRCSAAAAGWSMLAGLAGGIVAWVVAAQALLGAVNAITLADSYAVLAGSTTAIALPFLVAGAVSWWRPDAAFAWESLAAVGDAAAVDAAAVDADAAGGGGEGKAAEKAAAAAAEAGAPAPPPLRAFDRYNAAYAAVAVAFTLLVGVVWPALTLPAGEVFSEGYFTFYVALCLGWLLASFAAVTLWPLLEYRALLAGVFGAWSRGARPAVLATPSGKLQVSDR
jgi:hypothetical protein